MSSPTVDSALLESSVRAREPGSLRSTREAALSRFLQHGLPTVRHEDWRYTNLRPAVEISNAWLAGGASDVAATESPAAVPQGIEAAWVSIRNGRIDDRTLAAATEKLGNGVALTRLSSASDVPDVYMEDAVSSLNAALLEDALCVDVEDGATFEIPLGIDLADATGETPGTCQVRLLIRLGKRASASFVELHRSQGAGAHFANVVVEMHLQEDAVANYAKVQERDPRHIQIGRLQARLEKNSRLAHAAIDLGGRMIRNDVSAELASAGAHFESAGLSLTEDGQHVDSHITADHLVGPATSRQNHRAIASGQSRYVFNGKAIVREGADGTDAEQSNHNLLLSKRAEIDTKPELEIYAEDVKCAHGATVGQLDEKALFYLQTRGLAREEAAQLLTRSFANSILDEVPVPAARAYCEAAADRKLDYLIRDARDD